MFRHLFVLSVITLVLVGCSSPGTTVTDGAGNKVSVSGDGTKVSVTDAQGKTATMETDKQGSTTIRSDDGTKTTQIGTSISEADLGINVYPASKEVQNGSSKVDSPDEKVVVSSRTTTDAPSKVAEFYKILIKNSNSTSSNSAGNESELVSGKLDDGSDVTVLAVKDQGKDETTIMVTVRLSKKK